MTNNIQMWKTDPDPSLIELDSVVENGYVTYTDTIAPLGSDLVFCNVAGFQSAGQMLYTDRMISADIGAPVSNIVKPKLATDAATNEPIAIHFSGNDQYICAIKDEMFVLTHSTNAQLTAWSRYTMAQGSVISGICSYRDLLYVKMSNASGSFIFGFDPGKYNFSLTGDNPYFQGMYESALISTGGSIMGAELLCEGSVDRVFNIGGGLHHAAPDRASGFCVFNDPVIAINHFLDKGMRVAYIDIDCHHGDGVQNAYYDSDQVIRDPPKPHLLNIQHRNND